MCWTGTKGTEEWDVGGGGGGGVRHVVCELPVTDPLGPR